MVETKNLTHNTITREIPNEEVSTHLVPTLASIETGLLPERVLALYMVSRDREPTLATSVVWVLVTASVPPLTE